MSPEIARGSVWIFVLDPVAGSEQRSTRPCVVVQRDSANRSSPSVIACPLTTARKSGSLLNVFVRAPEGGLRRDSFVICNQIRAMDRQRIRGTMLGTLGEKTMALVDQGLRAILDLGDE